MSAQTRSISKQLSFGLWVVLVTSTMPSHANDLPDEVRALMAKERARNITAAMDRSMKSGGDSKDGDSQKKNGPTIHRKGVVGGCDMQVGNSQARPGTMNSKPQPVIITGPVVQVCK